MYIEMSRALGFRSAFHLFFYFLANENNLRKHQHIGYHDDPKNGWKERIKTLGQSQGHIAVHFRYGNFLHDIFCIFNIFSIVLKGTR